MDYENLLGMITKAVHQTKKLNLYSHFLQQDK